MNKRIQEIFEYLRDQWITVLVVMVLVTTVAFVVLIFDSRKQEGETVKINLTVRQAEFIESIALAALQLVNEYDVDTHRKNRGRMLDKINQLEDAHLSLSHGNRYVRQGINIVRLPGSLSDGMRSLYYEQPHNLDKQLKEYISQAKSFLRVSADEFTPSHPNLFYLFGRRPCAGA